MAFIDNSLGENNGNYNSIWGSITGNIIDQIDLINYLESNFYPLLNNPAGYITLADVPVFNPLNYDLEDFNNLSSNLFIRENNLSQVALTGDYNDLFNTPTIPTLISQLINDSNFITSVFANSNYYPLLTNPAGYLTQKSVLEFPNLSSFPNPGNDNVIYIAADTGLTYTWNTVTSIYEPTSSPNTGITGVGIVNRVAKFSPNGTTLTSSKIGDGLIPDVITIDYAGRNINAGNTLLSIQRSQCQVDFTLGNPLLSQTTYLYSDNDLGFEIKSKGYISLKAGSTFSNEGLLVLPTGKLRFPQTPDSGTILDKILVRDTTGNVKSLTPFDYFDAKPIVYQKHTNIPSFGSPGINNVEGVSILASGPVARNWADTDIVTRTQRMGLAVSTTGNLAQLRQTIVYFSRNGGFDLTTGFNMAENASDTAIRFFIGLSTTTLFSNVEPNTLLNCIGVCRLSSSDNLHLINNDNTGTGTTIDLGTNFPANTISTDKYLINIKTVSTGVYLKLDRIGTAFSYETILTSDIPSTSTGLNFGAYIVDTTGANATTGFDWYGSYIII